MTWHVDTATVTRYLRGGLTEAYACSVEAHLLSCPSCRLALAAVASGTPTDGSGTSGWAGTRVMHEQTWERVLEGVDRPSAGPVLRLLGRWIPDHLLRPVLAAPALRNAACVAGLVALGVATLIGNLDPGGGGTLVFLATAPVVPLVGVAFAYASPDELCGELGDALPYSRFRLLLQRTLAVVAMTLPAMLVLSVALPVNLGIAMLWLVPSLALCAVTLSLSPLIDSRVTAGVLGVLWLVAATNTLRAGPGSAQGIQDLLDRSVVFRSEGQLVLVCVAAVAVAVAIVRRSTYDSRSAL